MHGYETSDLDTLLYINFSTKPSQRSRWSPTRSNRRYTICCLHPSLLLCRDLRATGSEDVVGLALSALATVASRDIARDLADEVARLLLSSSDANIRKRATACAVRLVRQAPDLAELFIDTAESQFKSSLTSSGGGGGGSATRRKSTFPGRASEEIPASSHSVVLTACHLLSAILAAATVEQARFLDVSYCRCTYPSLIADHSDLSEASKVVGRLAQRVQRQRHQRPFPAMCASCFAPLRPRPSRCHSFEYPRRHHRYPRRSLWPVRRVHAIERICCCLSTCRLHLIEHCFVALVRPAKRRSVATCSLFGCLR